MAHLEVDTRLNAASSGALVRHAILQSAKGLQHLVVGRDVPQEADVVRLVERCHGLLRRGHRRVCLRPNSKRPPRPLCQSTFQDTRSGATDSMHACCMQLTWPMPRVGRHPPAILQKVCHRASLKVCAGRSVCGRTRLHLVVQPIVEDQGVRHLHAVRLHGVALPVVVLSHVRVIEVRDLRGAEADAAHGRGLPGRGGLGWVGVGKHRDAAIWSSTFSLYAMAPVTPRSDVLWAALLTSSTHAWERDAAKRSQCASRAGCQSKGLPQHGRLAREDLSMLLRSPPLALIRTETLFAACTQRLMRRDTAQRTTRRARWRCP